jgi:hypothetical protein
LSDAAVNGEVGKRRPYFSDSKVYSKVFFFVRGNTPANFHLHTEKDTPLSAPPLSTIFFAHTVVRTIFREGVRATLTRKLRRRGEGEILRAGVLFPVLKTKGLQS